MLIFCVGRTYAVAAAAPVSGERGENCKSASSAIRRPPPSLPVVRYSHHSFVSSVINITDEPRVSVSCITGRVSLPPCSQKKKSRAGYKYGEIAPHVTLHEPPSIIIAAVKM